MAPSFAESTTGRAASRPAISSMRSCSTRIPAISPAFFPVTSSQACSVRGSRGAPSSADGRDRRDRECGSASQHVGQGKGKTSRYRKSAARAADDRCRDGCGRCKHRIPPKPSRLGGDDGRPAFPGPRSCGVGNAIAHPLPADTRLTRRRSRRSRARVSCGRKSKLIWERSYL